eukprot:4179975-Lingulodinium_polyedra.AAC.1
MRCPTAVPPPWRQRRTPRSSRSAGPRPEPVCQGWPRTTLEQPPCDGHGHANRRGGCRRSGRVQL